MSSEQGSLGPNDPEYYAPSRLRERAKSGSLSQGSGLEPLRSPISLPTGVDIQLKNAVSNALRRPLDPEVIHESARLTHELDRRAALLRIAPRVAAGFVTVAVLLFFILMPASRRSDAGSAITALPLSGKGDAGSRPAIAEFQAFLAAAAHSQPATAEPSQLQQFLQWRQKANATEN